MNSQHLEQSTKFSSTGHWFS